MSLLSRIGMWLGTWVLCTVAIVWLAVIQSQRHLAVDPSSMAWTGFIPLLFPLFLMQTAVYIIPVIVIVEIALWLFRKYR